MKFKVALFSVLFFLCLKGRTQVTADPALGNIFFTDITGTTVLNANALVINVPVLIHLPVYNNSDVNAIPTGSTNIRLGLNTHMILDPTYDLTTAPMSEYYTWSQLVTSQTQLIGSPQIAAVPADFIGEAVFRVIPNVLGGPRTITANYNTPDPSLLLDQVSSNNSALLTYTVVSAPVPVTFTKLLLSKKGCNINVNFFTEQEINVSHFEIEASKNGTDFTKVATVKAASRASYVTDFTLTKDITSTVVMVRVKSVDLDGRVQYSATKTINGLCEGALAYNIYPNPVAGSRLTILATDGIFNGKYKVSLMDMTGRIIQTEDAEMINATRYTMDINKLASGKYILRITGAGEGKSLQFEKL